MVYCRMTLRIHQDKIDDKKINFFIDFCIMAQSFQQDMSNKVGERIIITIIEESKTSV